MKKLLLIALASLVGAAAVAAPNHTRSEYSGLGPPQEARNSGIMARSFSVVRRPTKPSTGLDATTVIPGAYGDGSDATPEQIAHMADGAVQQTDLNAPNGVSGLNAASEAVSPVNTSGAVSQGAQSAVPKLPYTGWTTNEAAYAGGPIVTMGKAIPNMADRMALFGGHRLYDSMFSKFYALPYGVGDGGGCVHSVLMTFAPGTGANCGAGGWDAVTQYELASNNPPWLVAGADFRDEDGVAHSVTFTANGAFIRPALTPADQTLLKSGMHVLTNIVAGPVVYSGKNLDGDATHMNRDQQFYGGMLGTWRDGSDGDGTFTQITLGANWSRVTADSTAVDAGHIPAVGTINNAATGRTDVLDTDIYGAYTHPLLAFGTYIKHFTRNTTCLVRANADATGGDAAKLLGASRKCDEEIDMWYYGPDYGATMHGLTIGYAGNKPSNDSYGLAIAGALPTGERIWLGADGHDIDGDIVKSGRRQGPAPTVGAAELIWEWWQQPSTKTAYNEAVKLWARVNSVSNPASVNNPVTGQDVSYWLGPRESSTQFKIDGWMLGALGFNPVWSPGGAVLCGTNETDNTGNACLTVAKDGAVNTQRLTVNGRAIVNGQLVEQTVTISTLPAAVADGAEVWVQDCYINGVKGCAARWHQNAGHWMGPDNKLLQSQ
ncbi:hypothetical protein HK16_10550 [Acetobacter senegalensis]|uniref:Uncharacterized protein n=2 Tax=Acetobacter TaxID=434 RepID=A0A252EIX8_9PROT|nr:MULTISPECIES: hypothetical protein [Acetobacter]ATJ89441.1 hypothetical protein CIW82_00590 [Acetobacter tropicalis]OUL66316.1 hypothetical protein HK16_10550 [Acetobacter senegalensis]